MIAIGESGVCGGIVRVELDRTPEECARLHVVRARRSLQCRSGAQNVVVRFETFGRPGRRTPLLDLCHLDRQGSGDLSGDLVLQGEDVRQCLVEAGRPKHPSVRIDKLRAHAHAVADLADAALDLIPHPHAAGDLPRAFGWASVWRNGVP